MENRIHQVGFLWLQIHQGSLGRCTYTSWPSYPLTCSSSRICVSHLGNFIPKLSYLALLCQATAAEVLDASCNTRGEGVGLPELLGDPSH